MKWDLETGFVGAGVNTNAYLAPSDSNSAEAALFWPAAVDAGIRFDPQGRLDLGFDYSFDGTFHRDEILNVYRHRLEAWQRWRRLSLGALHDLDLQLEQTFRTKNRTYFGRGYSEEIETASGNPPAQESPLADRFDWREGSLVADLDFGPYTGLSSDLRAGFVRRDYVDDYEQDPNTYSLDQNRWVGRWRVRWRSENDFWVRLALGLEDRRYDEKYAREADGTENPGVQTHLMYWPIDLEFGRRPRSGLRWDARLGAERIVDRYEGYWDRTYWRADANLAWVFPSGHSVGAQVRRSITNYDRSRVGNTTAGPIREKDMWVVGIEATALLTPHWQLVAWSEVKDRNNNSPMFDYTTWVSMAGLTYTF
jgi:hypothetical protein